MSPASSPEPQLVAVGLVDQHLWLGGIEGGTDELHIEEVDPHTPWRVRHRPLVTAFGIFDAPDGREVPVMNGQDRIVVFVQGGSDLLELR